MSEKASSPSNAGQWWLSEGGKPEGPYSEAYIVARIRGGAIRSRVLACQSGAEEWKPLNNWPQFSRHMPDKAGPCPPPMPSANDRTSSQIPPSTQRKLPLMASAICVYCLVIAPILWLVGLIEMLATGGSSANLNADSPILVHVFMCDVICTLVGLGIVVVIVVGGLQLMQLRKIGLTTVKIALAADLAWGGICFLTFMFLDALIVLTTTAPPLEEETSWGYVVLWFLILILALGLLVFEIVALVWLCRHGKELPLVDN